MVNRCNYFIAGVLFLFSCASKNSDFGTCPNFGKKNDLKDRSGVDTVLAVVDTVEITDHIVISFSERHEGTSMFTQKVLVPKTSLDTSLNYDGTKYRDFICKTGYVFLTDLQISCLVNNLLYNFPALQSHPFYSQLQNDLRDAEKDTIWVADRNNEVKSKNYLGLKYYEIYPKKFLLFWVKGSALRRCQDMYAIVIKGMDDVYFKVLVPLPKWDKL